MIDFYTETNFIHKYKKEFINWLQQCVIEKQFTVKEINFIFVNDSYLHTINLKFLNHDTYTDIITFDYSKHKQLAADIFISIDRVHENAQKFNITFYKELSRVMIHGILHLMGYDDKTKQHQLIMRKLEDDCLNKLKFN